MRSFLASAIASSALVAVTGAVAAPNVSVKWIAPERFADAGISIIDRERTLDALTMHLQQLGQALPAGQTLHLEVTDLDLAGEPERMMWPELRVLRDRADWPRMSLRYALRDGARELASGEAELADMAYMFGRTTTSLANIGDLPYEKRMIDAWFKATILAR
jgi:hypothetical protein